MTRARDNSFNPFNNQVAGKNYFINGSMEFWQRGTSFTTPGGAYTADRWKATVNGAGTYIVSRQAAGLDGLQYCMRFQRSSGQTYNSGSFIGYAWETEAMIGLQGKTVTYSFYARKGSDFSSTSPSSGINVQLMQGTGSGTHAFSSLTNESAVLTGNATLTTSWQRFSFTGTVASNSTELRTNIAHSPNGTAGANDYFEITGIQLEIGSSATQFSRSGGTIGGELALCQRYYQKSYLADVVPGTNTQNGLVNYQSISSTAINNRCWVPLKTIMRTSPSITTYSVPGNVNTATNEVIGNYNIAIQFQSEGSFNLYPTSGTFAAGQVCNFHYVASAEL